MADPRIARALRALESEMHDPPPIRRLAASAGLSLHHFHRLFLAETGETPARYLRRLRLDAAALRLRWSGHSVGAIAGTLGYDSQAAFTRAFAARFEAPPGRFRRDAPRPQDAAALRREFRRIAVREVEPLPVIARRYVGDPLQVRGFWRDFARRLPRAIAARASTRYYGLMHDDPRITGPDRARYDCCAGLDGRAPPPGGLERLGLELLSTRPGRYARIEHHGPRESVAASYYLVCDHWAPARRQVIPEAPAIEVHAVRRDLQPPGDLRFTILVPIE